jgi:large subunit ribosomal protein L25
MGLMAHTIDLEVQPRTITGKKVKKLRREGIIPGNVYGHGMESTAVQVEVKTLENVLKHATGTTLVNLKVGSAARRRPVFVRDVRYTMLRRVPEHVDFFAVRMDEAMRAAVPVVFRGEAPAAKNADYMLFHPVSEVTVSGLPGDLPEAIAVDVTGLTALDQTIYAKDLHLPENVTLLDDPEEIIIKVQLVRAAVEEEAPAEAEAPEGEAPAEGEQAAEGEGEGEAKPES